MAISEVDELFRVKFRLSTTWKDTRLTFVNLKKHASRNKVGMEEGLNIWYPTVEFVNTKSMDLSKVKHIFSQRRSQLLAYKPLFTSRKADRSSRGELCSFLSGVRFYLQGYLEDTVASAAKKSPPAISLNIYCMPIRSRPCFTITSQVQKVQKITNNFQN